MQLPSFTNVESCRNSTAQRKRLQRNNILRKKQRLKQAIQNSLVGLSSHGQQNIFLIIFIFFIYALRNLHNRNGLIGSFYLTYHMYYQRFLNDCIIMYDILRHNIKEVDIQMNHQVTDSNPKYNEARKRMISSLKIGLKSKIETVKDSKMVQSAKIHLEKQQVDGNISSDQNQTSQNTNLTKPNQQFNQKYDIMVLIGHGRNGSVYKCVHKQSKKQYAVKKIKYQKQHILFLKENFYHVQKLKHPSIIRYKSIYIEANKRTCFLVMQLFSHKQLSEFKLDNQNQIKNIIYKVLDAVRYLHIKGICHRDIKPDNILYDQKKGEIKIIDFGVSKQFRIRKFVKQLMTPTGTQFYKAPQMICGGIYNQLIDQWAVGITLYKLITGYTPFQSNYISEVNEKIKQGRIHFDKSLWDKYGMAKDLVESLLKNSKERKTADEALKHLWFEKNKINLVSSIRVPIQKKFEISQTLDTLNLFSSYKINDPLAQTTKIQNKKYLRQSLKDQLSYIGQSWCYSEDQYQDNS